MRKLLILTLTLMWLTPNAIAKTTGSEAQRHEKWVRDMAIWANKNSQRPHYVDGEITRYVKRTSKYRKQVSQELTSYPFTWIKIPVLIPVPDLTGRTSYSGIPNFYSWYLNIGRMKLLSKHWAINPSAELQFGYRNVDDKKQYLTGLGLQTEFNFWGLVGAGPAILVHQLQLPDRKDPWVVTPCISITLSSGLYFSWRVGLPFSQEFKRYSDWQLGVSFPILNKASRKRLESLRKEIKNEIRIEMTKQLSATPCN